MINLPIRTLCPLTLVTFLIVFSNLTIAQTFKISGVIVNSETKEILPFASLMVLNKTLGISADKSGSFELILPDSLWNDTLVISYVGFQPKKMCINDYDNKSVALVPQIINLSEIVIKPSTNKKKFVTINSFGKNDGSVRYSLDPLEGQGNLWVPFRPKEPSIETIYFPYQPDYDITKRIKEVWLCLTNYKSTPTHFRLRILKANENHTPGNDLLTNPLLVEVLPHRQIIKISLEEFNLYFPETGLFVGVELLITPENGLELKNNLGNVIVSYSPFLNYVTTKETDYKYWLYSKGIWTEEIQKVPEYTKTIKNHFYKPAISLMITN